MSRTTTVDTVPAGEVSVAGASRPDPFIKRGTPQFMRVTLALFSAGLATFALLYCVQPILPVLSNEFGVSPASSSISLSISTAMLAVGLLFTGPLSDAIGRKPVMVTALLLAACCSLLSTMMTSWHGILIMRALIGLSLSGVAAVGMTYLSEEIHPSFRRLFDGTLYQRQLHRRHERPLADRGLYRFLRLARGAGGDQRLCAGRGDYVLAYPARVAPFPPDLAATENAAD
ncbi:major facilitator superfamily permease [Klebsiella pneumoniae]|uniref:Major facilitator superfamily permease n=1 Tax=Klebsiella pneumoniae TaxID=573 RepID=A0A378F436_KLEPN|nr:major facilitator superfamily permease [Klebsiella pneumoniae]